MKKVNNPLTIVAIFAGLAEVACTAALVALDKDIQSIFVWFVMLFPCALVMLFYITLWWKPTSLYAPSDYDNEDNFLNAIGVTLTINETIDSLKNDLNALKTQMDNSAIADDLKKDIESKIASMSDQLSASREELANYQLVLSESDKSHRVTLSMPGYLKRKAFNISKENNVPLATVIAHALEQYEAKR